MIMSAKNQTKNLQDDNEELTIDKWRVSGRRRLP